MKILITGATGLIGSRLLPYLARRDHDLIVLSRNPEKAARQISFPCQIHAWDPATQSPSPKILQGTEAVIHLAGEPIARGRWTEERKKQIYDSRVLSTQKLLKSLAQVDSLHTLISGSAIGFYGDRHDEILRENSEAGTDFLAELCRDWEKEATTLDSRVRTVLLRTGIVLSEREGALPEMLRPFRMGAGGPLGDGRQWLSWIHIEDHVRAIAHALENREIRGPLNAVGPSPVRQAEFAQALGKVLSKPAWIKTPPWALKIALGEMAQAILGSQRVLPEVLLKTGFKFQFSNLETALRDLIGYEHKSGTRKFFTSQWIPKPVNEVFSFFSDEKNLETITPPWLNFHVLGKTTPKITDRTEIDYRLRIHGIPVHWRSKITQWEENQKFTDIQIKGPYACWEHTHRFTPMKGGTWIEDDIIYRTPGGGVLHPMIGSWILSDVQKIFNYRREKIREIFSAKPIETNKVAHGE